MSDTNTDRYGNALVAAHASELCYGLVWGPGYGGRRVRRCYYYDQFLCTGGPNACRADTGLLRATPRTPSAVNYCRTGPYVLVIYTISYTIVRTVIHT